MKIWSNILKLIAVLLALAVLGFGGLLYLAFEQQKGRMESMVNQQQINDKIDSNRFKYVQAQIDEIRKDVSDTKQELSDQKEAFVQEIERRQQLENDSKNIQTSLVDIKAETDAIKQDMRSWQKDYVTVLAQLEKKMDNAQQEIKSVQDNLTANIGSLKTEIEKMTPPPAADTGAPVVDNSVPPADNSLPPEISNTETPDNTETPAGTTSPT